MDLEQLYRQVIMEHYKRPKNKGLLNIDSYELIHLNNPSCGDEIAVEVLYEDDTIKDIRHDGKGCSICCSSASIMSVMLKDKQVDDAKKIIYEYYEMIKGYPFNDQILNGDILAYQGVTKFPARIKCATLAWKAIEVLLEKHGGDRNNGW